MCSAILNIEDKIIVLVSINVIDTLKELPDIHIQCNESLIEKREYINKGTQAKITIDDINGHTDYLVEITNVPRHYKKGKNWDEIYTKVISKIEK